MVSQSSWIEMCYSSYELNLFKDCHNRYQCFYSYIGCSSWLSQQKKPRNRSWTVRQYGIQWSAEPKEVIKVEWDDAAEGVVIYTAMSKQVSFGKENYIY
jgi:hypothetical protein